MGGCTSFPVPFHLGTLPVRECPYEAAAQDDPRKSASPRLGWGPPLQGAWLTPGDQPFHDCEELLDPSARSFWPPALQRAGSAPTDALCPPPAGLPCTSPQPGSAPELAVPGRELGVARSLRTRLPVSCDMHTRTHVHGSGE